MLSSPRVMGRELTKVKREPEIPLDGLYVILYFPSLLETPVYMRLTLKEIYSSGSLLLTLVVLACNPNTRETEAGNLL